MSRAQASPRRRRRPTAIPPERRRYRLPHPESEPPGHDEVLAAVAHYHRPGDRVSLEDILRAIAITPARAATVEQWARRNGAWPYLRPKGGEGP